MNPRGVVRLRRTVQGALLLFFLILVLWARPGDPERPPRLLQLFFNLDPLILFGTWLSAHAVPAAAWLALLTLALTVLLGRVFCGWICPLGTVHNVVSWLRRRLRRKRPDTDTFSRWQRGKYYLLVGLLIMAALGAHWFGVFDPFSLLYRSTTTAVFPAAQYGIEDSATAIYRANPHLGPLHATSVSEPIYRVFRDRVFVEKRQVFSGGTLLGGLFLLIVLMNLYRQRFWCRYLCPLGGLLGVFSRRTGMRVVATSNECTHCGRCAVRCPAAAQPEKRGEWLPSECFGCWNCAVACNNKAIAIEFTLPFRRPSAGKLDLSKRALITSCLAGLGGLLLFRITPQAQGRTYNPALIRPPGARPEREFLQRCIQCGLCMRVCPTNGIQPTLAEAGIEGLWTPRMIMRIGHCEYGCNRCGRVCPTGAIENLALEDKKKLKIGLAYIDTTRCIPYAYGRNCMVCEEHCPTAPKAIYFVDKPVDVRGGATLVLKQPRVDPDLCIGCGICEAKCPFRDRAAIIVTSANETRHLRNQPILPGGGATPSPGVGAYPPGQPSLNPYGG